MTLPRAVRDIGSTSALALTVAFALCACSLGNFEGVGDGGSGACQVTITFDPAQPQSNETIRAVASLTGAVGVPTYSWSVSFEGQPVTTMQAAGDNSQIDFFANAAGVYVVDVDPGLSGCTPDVVNLNVDTPGGTLADYIQHVVPPATLAPPQDTEFQIAGGANVSRPISIDPGLSVTGTITDGSGNGISAYVRFLPTSQLYAAIETFTGSDGSFSTLMLGQPYTALIIPSEPGLAPTSATWMPGMTTTIAVPTGTAITGKVLDPTGVGLAGATVQLTDGTVPSTIATTASDGSFTVLGWYLANQSVTVNVTPPSGRGLPSLSATAAFATLQVQYASTLATCNVSGTAVQRAGTNQANVGVTFVGSFAAAGTMTANGSASPATASVQIATTTTASGLLPALLVPKAALSAVVAVAPSTGDFAVASIDLATCAATTIVAPALQPVGTTITDVNDNSLAGVLVRILPDGALATAGAQELDAMTGSNGAFSAMLASGGQYDVLIADPAGRGGPVLLSSIGAASVPTTISLPSALQLSGMVSVIGNANPVPGVSIEIYCGNCTPNGNGPTRPIAETASDSTSSYQVAIPNPGTM